MGAAILGGALLPSLVQKASEVSVMILPKESRGMVEAPPDQEWLRKPEAAVRLGISERAIDMQVRAGKLPRRARPDGKVEVLVPKAPETVQAERGLELVERYEQ